MANEEQPKEIITITDSAKIDEDMSGFYQKTTFSDVNLVLANKTIPAHKIVLASRCKYFKSIITEDPKQSEIFLKDVPPKAFDVVLNYIYTGSIFIKSSQEDEIVDVLQLAHKYSLKKLEKTITVKMTSIINMSNVCLLLNKADELDMEELRKICLDFIDKHFPEIIDTNFLNVLTQNSMVKLLERDVVPANEIDIFKLAANWCKNNVDTDNLVIGCVRLNELTEDHILDLVWPSKLIESDVLMHSLVSIRNKIPNEQRTNKTNK
ncbi:hypothetical protein Zmor_024286 [Zophobas morio]|uniref:BTB domain-containing protein n=1 Tax=Zophobas morio TaxID=2755281 RepID=A0AA38I0C1_9CUCU|nr:hypothetical protein Zmor_024286 [Zophobas morio]